ncbi:Nucleoside 5-triphosphatase RdgB (dHAPTP, dITP, XTP-specific) [Lunatimonas lonarensis]|uniref:dITP/XTP pyrophosphatase n=1 Tax=Lunatimonas lonarensis TaxID=1232681 RepID=R7ZXX5_9BACT|nr:non-canonical purine NTP diphosphatase [Lunatimonas lonarensis]EON78868.1 Nucleoside 5-triphosphatase RdgB (dHAPTP, dITP, XTP-specific) [Lunatimonas lonarensis]
MQRICFASNNPKKLEEIRAALGGKIEIISLREIGCTEELPETGDTLEHNAFEKARYLHDHYRIDCFADDTGLEVEALKGAPGVYSAMYAGEPRNDVRNVDLLLETMEGQENRNAAFRTIIALILNGKEYQFEGKVSGKISTERSGSGGFGYDPVFIPEGFDKTFAQFSMEEKNAVSHRGKAVSQLAAFLLEQS